jgi:hypothetical protein
MMGMAEAYDKLIADLENAWGVTRRNHLLGQSLTLGALLGFLRTTGAPDKALQSAAWTYFTIVESDWILRHKGKSGPKHRAFAELTSLVSCAAAVSVMKDQKSCSVEHAITQIARRAKIPKSEIKKFRDSIHRGTADEAFTHLYKEDLIRFAGLLPTELDDLIKRAGILYDRARGR